MKTVPALILAFLTAASLAGCNAVPTDTTNLMQPPKLTAEQQGIEQALEKYVGTKFTLEYPREGSYRSAFVIHNKNATGEKEAVAFYRPSNENAGTHVAVLEKNEKTWKRIVDISGEGNGNEVDLVDFGDFDGDGVNDIAIGWTQFTSGTDLRLSVYSLKAKTYKRVYSGSFTKMKVLDINNDGKQDILLVEQDTVAKKSTARLVSYSCGRLSEIASVPLDSTVSSYAELYETTVGKNDKGVLLDGYKGAHSMVTELVYWKNGSLQVPLYDKRSGTVISTFRDDPVACSDLDEDGTVEIPFPVVMQGYEKAAYSKKLWTVRWADFAPATGSGSVFQTKFSCVINSAEHYYFILPGDLVKKTGFAGNVTVDKKNGDSDWIFCQWDPKSKSEGRLLFAIRSYTTQEWSSLTNKKSLNVIYQNDLTTYAAILGQKQGNDDPLYLTLDQIRNNFKIIS